MTDRGFTLVELTITLGLGAIVLAGVVLSLSNGGRRQREADAIARLQERATFALGVVEPEVQMAGYGGLVPLHALSRPAGGLAGANGCGHFDIWPLEAVTVESGPWVLPCAAHAGGVVDEAHRLTVRRAGTRAAVPEAGRVQVLTHRLQSTPPAFVLAGHLPAGTAARAGATELHDLLAQTLYVARASDGSATEPALRVKELTSIAGRPAIRDTEVIDGIDDLRVEAGWRGGAEGPLRFGPPGARPANEILRALRVSVRARSALHEPDLPPQVLTYAAQDFEFHDGHRRLALTRTFTLRNAPVQP